MSNSPDMPPFIRRRTVLGAVAAVVVLAAAPAVSRAQPAAIDGPDVRAFVQFDDAVTDADLAALRAAGVVTLRSFDLVPFVAVAAPRAVLDRVAAVDGVLGVQADRGIRLLTDKSKPATRVNEVRRKVPDGFGLTGKGVTVAVLDSGVDTTHPDLADRVVASYNFEGALVTDTWQDGAGSDDAAAAGAPYAAVDEVGHGTHVAGTIAGTGAAARSERDFSGMAPGANIVNYKIASAAQGVAYDFGWEVNAMAAIEHLVEHNHELGVKVVSNSWGVFEVTDPDSEPVIQMVRAAIAKGLLFVFAAGNEGDGPNTVGWPGAMGNVITVAATEKVAPYAVADFSSRGYQVDVAAPGVDIVAPRSKVSVIDFGGGVADTLEDSAMYMAISGTSMATPHVAGIAALLLEANPALTPPQVEEILERTATDLGTPGHDHSYGWGFVDAVDAVHVARCLGTVRADTCYARVGGLSGAAWRSDWTDKGNASPTSQGSVVPPV